MICCSTQHLFRRIGLLLVVSAGIAGSGCESDEDRRPSVLVRDSTGVSIVEVHGPVWHAGEGWRVASVPEVVIGVVDGDEEYQLHRVVGTTRLADGRIVVANAGTHDLRVYNSNGEFERRIGSRGDGPGEFQRLRMLARLRGDTLLAFDLREHRVSVIDPDGQFVDAYRVQPPAGSPELLGVFSDGSVLMRGITGLTADGSLPATGVHQVRGDLHRIGRDSRLIGSFGPFPGAEVYVRVGGTFEYAEGARALGIEPRVAVAGEEFYFGPTVRYEISKYDERGGLSRIIRRSIDPTLVEAADRAAFIRQVVDEQDPRLKEYFEDWYAGMPFPESFPAHAEMLVDSEAHLWVKEYPSPRRDQNTWRVFDGSGSMLGSVEVPQGLTVREVGSDYVLGTARDDLDVEQVLLYRLHRD
jgi:hypothetical protein